MAESIRDAEGGVQSVPEREFALLVRRSGLPAPTRQRMLQRPNGRYYLDADWSDFGFCAEVQGSQHQEFVAWDGDLDRQNEVSAGGRRVLQFTSYTVRRRGDRVTDLLWRSLHTGGWSGRVRRS